MSNGGLVLSSEQHERVCALAMMLQSIVMGDGKKALSFNAVTRSMFITSMDELIEILQVRDAFSDDGDG